MTDSQRDQDVIEVLTTDHTEATSLIAQIRGSNDPEGRRDLADTLISEPVRHSVAEEMFVYPSCRQRGRPGGRPCQGSPPAVPSRSASAQGGGGGGGEQARRATYCPFVLQCQGSLGRLCRPKRAALSASQA